MGFKRTQGSSTLQSLSSRYEVDLRMHEVEEGLTHCEQRIKSCLPSQSRVLDIGYAVGRASIAFQTCRVFSIRNALLCGFAEMKGL